TDHPRTWIAPVRDSIYDYRDFFRTLAGEPAGTPERVPQYWANERTYAAYAQTHYEFEIGTVRVDGQIGIRAVRTENDIRTAGQHDHGQEQLRRLSAQCQRARPFDAQSASALRLHEDVVAPRLQPVQSRHHRRRRLCSGTHLRQQRESRSAADQIDQL